MSVVGQSVFPYQYRLNLSPVWRLYSLNTQAAFSPPASLRADSVGTRRPVRGCAPRSPCVETGRIRVANISIPRFGGSRANITPSYLVDAAHQLRLRGDFFRFYSDPIPHPPLRRGGAGERARGIRKRRADPCFAFLAPFVLSR